MKILLNQRKRDALKTELNDNLIYRVIKSLQSILNEYKGLSIEDIFCECICQIDNIKYDPQEAIVEKEDLYAILVGEMADNGIADTLIPSAATIIETSLLYLIGLKDNPVYNMLTQKLAIDIERHADRELCLKVGTSLRNKIINLEEEKVAKFVSDYIDDENYLSDSIDEMLQNDYDENATAPERTSTLSIAKNKKTSWVVLLHAAYNAGWIVTKDGKKPSAKYQTIEEIVRNAFGENIECKTLLQSANNPIHNKDGVKKYIEELLRNLD